MAIDTNVIRISIYSEFPNEQINNGDAMRILKED